MKIVKQKKPEVTAGNVSSGTVLKQNNRYYLVVTQVDTGARKFIDLQDYGILTQLDRDVPFEISECQLIITE